VLSALNRQDEAFELGQQVFETRKTVLGETHPDTLISMGNVGMLHKKLGNLSEAHNFLSKAIELATANDHPQLVAMWSKSLSDLEEKMAASKPAKPKDTKSRLLDKLEKNKEARAKKAAEEEKRKKEAAAQPPPTDADLDALMAEFDAIDVKQEARLTKADKKLANYIESCIGDGVGGGVCGGGKKRKPKKKKK